MLPETDSPERALLLGGPAQGSYNGGDNPAAPTHGSRREA